MYVITHSSDDRVVLALSQTSRRAMGIGFVLVGASLAFLGVATLVHGVRGVCSRAWASPLPRAV